MPRVYIARLVFDFGHKSLVAIKNDQVIGGITFRPFLDKAPVPFIEVHVLFPWWLTLQVVFCVITKPEQRGGYGSRLMNQLKAWSKQNAFNHLLTYADDTAIGYFQRQGFSCEIGMAPSEWDVGFLKYYDSATLMHCQLDPAVGISLKRHPLTPLQITSTLRTLFAFKELVMWRSCTNSVINTQSGKVPKWNLVKPVLT